VVSGPARLPVTLYKPKHFPDLYSREKKGISVNPEVETDTLLFIVVMLVILDIDLSNGPTHCTPEIVQFNISNEINCHTVHPIVSYIWILIHHCIDKVSEEIGT
jgi:hypothetical protein